eukprot:COSAG02_NODE_9589_length_2168_cov_3.040116_1_plen_99_part_10
MTVRGAGCQCFWYTVPRRVVQEVPARRRNDVETHETMRDPCETRARPVRDAHASHKTNDLTQDQRTLRINDDGDQQQLSGMWCILTVIGAATTATMLTL